MAFTLGDLTLPGPKSLERDFQELSQTNTTIKNKTVKNVVNRKEVFTLTLQNLTVAQVNAIEAIHSLNRVVNFVADDTNLSIASTPVLIDIGAREYPKTGKNYLSNMTLILTEVS